MAPAGASDIDPPVALPMCWQKAFGSKAHTVLTDNGTHFTDPKGESWSVADIKRMLARREPFRAPAFEVACACNDIDQRLTKPKRPWANGQVE